MALAEQVIRLHQRVEDEPDFQDLQIGVQGCWKEMAKALSTGLAMLAAAPSGWSRPESTMANHYNKGFVGYFVILPTNGSSNMCL